MNIKYILNNKIVYMVGIINNNILYSENNKNKLLPSEVFFKKAKKWKESLRKRLTVVKEEKSITPIKKEIEIIDPIKKENEVAKEESNIIVPIDNSKDNIIKNKDIYEDYL